MEKFTEDKKYAYSFWIVLFAGLLWSFGAVVVKHMENPHNFLWEYLVIRGLKYLHFFFLFFIFLRKRTKIFHSFQRIQKSSFVGAICLSIAFIGFSIYLQVQRRQLPFLSVILVKVLCPCTTSFILNSLAPNTSQIP